MGQSSALPTELSRISQLSNQFLDYGVFRLSINSIASKSCSTCLLHRSQRGKICRIQELSRQYMARCSGWFKNKWSVILIYLQCSQHQQACDDCGDGWRSGYG